MPSVKNAPETPSHLDNRPPRPALEGSWTESALRVLRERYLARQGDEVVETPEDMCWRVAWAISEAELRYDPDPDRRRHVAEDFYQAMVRREFMPNSPTLMNAGRGNGLQYSACFVLPVEDSLEGIFDAIKNAAIIHQSGGGTGFSFSRLRAKDAPVRRSGGRASGPVSFLKVFDAATESVKQGGKRRGANMGVLRIDHPDVLEFIRCKLDGGITNFNISLGVTEAFMNALREGTSYALRAPETQEVVRHLDARQVWREIVDAAWRSGDPGLIFLDRVNQSPANPVPDLEEIEATNPCGEQPLAPNDACTLGSINLGQFVIEDEADARVDWEGLAKITHRAVRFLDDVLDVNPYPLDAIARTVQGNRRIGLGVMGWADMLFRLGLAYDSDEAVELADRVMETINREGHAASIELAQKRGPFPNFDRSIYAGGPPRRNATVTTIAPTGTISIISGCSSGIEPVFALAFRHIVGDRQLSFVNPIFAAKAEELLGPVRAEELISLTERRGMLQGLDAPEALKRVFVTAHEIPYAWHIRMQAAFQKYTDNGVSKTINLPHDASRDDVSRAYQLAYDLGCLGITVFRDGCKGTQVLHVGTGDEDEGRDEGAEDRPVASERPATHDLVRQRPAVAAGLTYRTRTPLGTAYVVVNRDDRGEPLEVFLNIGKAGSDIAAVSEGLGRLISLLLRLPSTLTPTERLTEIVDQLEGIGGANQIGFGKERVRSLPDAIARILSEYLGAQDLKGPGASQLDADDHSGGAPDLCLACGNATAVREEGCKKCYSCGHSEC